MHDPPRAMRTPIPRTALHEKYKVGPIALGCNRAASALRAPASGSPQDPEGAIGIHQRGGISSWDAMVIRSAAEIGCTVLYSGDLNVGQDYPGIHVENPFQLPEANQA
jgi:hypothetical protein